MTGALFREQGEVGGSELFEGRALELSPDVFLNAVQRRADRTAGFDVAVRESIEAEIDQGLGLAV